MYRGGSEVDFTSRELMRAVLEVLIPRTAEKLADRTASDVLKAVLVAGLHSQGQILLL